MRAHHGSIAREQRLEIEEELKAGRLPALVATSSLELGIDMGAVDLVIQVESPTSVARGLQRVGRAGHQVGAPSKGVIFPKYRGDLLEVAVVTRRMHEGAIEATQIPRNPLDVLAQQLVAMTVMDRWTVDDLLATVTRAAPYETLTRDVLDGVLGMLAGAYPSDEFAELKPRVVWDRVTDTIEGRRDARVVAVTSGGTIPDRGLFGVFMVGEAGTPGRRVGELDEEMVYELRAGMHGDVIVLGASSWRVEEIGHDRVTVSPAPGVPGKLPFWKGDAVGRPIELGRAIGAFIGEVEADLARGAAGRTAATTRLREHHDLDELAAENLIAYLEDEREATGALPTDQRIVVERFRDELGDWRLTLLTPFGGRVHAPWSLALEARLQERLGMEVQTIWSDDGIAIRLPEGETSLDGVEALLFPEADEVEDLVVGQVANSALFASRFRENAARALLLPRRRPGTRTPLWQQRQRSADLLAVASRYGSFPILVETYRECLSDVFDLDALREILRGIASRDIAVHAVETPRASPFASSLLFDYVAAYMYDGDTPLAERRAGALTLDRELLRELLGQEELRELLDPDALADLELGLQALADDRQAGTLDQVHDLLRRLGDLSDPEVAARTDRRGVDGRHVVGRPCRDPARGPGAHRRRRALDRDRGRRPLPRRGGGHAAGRRAGRIPGTGRGCARGPARAVRPHPRAVRQPRTGDALGVAGRDRSVTPSSGCWPTARCCSASSVRAAPSASGAIPTCCACSAVDRWRGCGARWSRSIRSRSRGSCPPGRAWRRPSGRAPMRPRCGATWRSSDSPKWSTSSPASPSRRPSWSGTCCRRASRVTSRGCSTSSGRWARSAGSGVAAWVAMTDGSACSGPAARSSGRPSRATPPAGPLATATSGSASTSRVVVQASIASCTPRPAAGRIATCSTRSGTSCGPERSPTTRSHRCGPCAGSARRVEAGTAPGGRVPDVSRRSGHPRRPAAGRSSSHPLGVTSTERLHAQALALLDRHGVLTREAVAGEGIEGGFAGVYPVLRALEDAGRIRRGYFVDGLGAAQFALAGALDRLRASREAAPSAIDRPVHVLAAADPANPYGAALPWPRRGEDDRRPLQRAAGAYVVLVDGVAALYLERGGATLQTLSPADDPEIMAAAVRGLGRLVADGRQRELVIRKVDGVAIAESPWRAALLGGGFIAGYRGLALRRRADMPEGDTLARTAAGLRPYLVGRELLAGSRPGPGCRAAGPARGRTADRRRRFGRQESAHPVRRGPGAADAPPDERLVASLPTGRAMAPAARSRAARPRGRRLRRSLF